MTRTAQAVLARALGLEASTSLPIYVQSRATEVDYYLQASRLPAEHPVVQAHAAAVAADWRTLEAAAAMDRSALDVLEALGQAAPPRPPASRRGMHPRPVWTVLSMAWTGRPDAEALPDVMLARADEVSWLLQAQRLSLEHPAVRACAARIAAESRAQEAARLARLAAGALRAWQNRPAWRRVLDALIAGGPGRQAPAPPAPQAGGKPNAPGRPAAAAAAPDQQEVWTTVKKWLGLLL